MMQRKPLTVAMMALFATPFAVTYASPAMAQSTVVAQSQGTTADTTQGTTPGAAPSATLPQTEVSGTSIRDEYQRDISTVGGKVPTAIRDIPQSVTVIDKAVMQAQGATSFADALRNSPAITLGGAEGGQIGNNINLRGFTARTDIYLDGLRDRGQYYRDTFDLDAIEVLEGPSSMLFGRGSTGGVINQVSKQANLKPLNEVSGTIGTNDQYRATFDLNHPLSDTAAFRINGFAQDIHTTRDVINNRDWGVAPTLKLGIGTPTQITLSALVQHNRDMADYGTVGYNGSPLPVSKQQFYGLTTDRTVQDVMNLSAKIEHRVDDSLKITNQTQYSRYVIDAIETSPHAVGVSNGTGGFTALPVGPTAGVPSYSLDQLWVQLQSHDRKITDSSLYNQTDVVKTFATGPVKHTLIAGAEFGQDTYENQAYSRTGAGQSTGFLGWIPASSTAYYANLPNVTTTARNLAQGTAQTVAFYANDTLELTRHWKVVGGLRWDRFKAQLSNTVSSPGYATQTVNYTSVRTGVIYQPSDAQSYYFSYGTSFNPSLETLTVTNNTQALAPATNTSFEVGSKWNLFNDNLAINTALFQVTQNNARTQTGTSGEYTNAGKVRIRGAQVSATGRITPNWQVMGGYMFLNSEVVQANDGTQGNVLANTPRHSLTLWSTYTLGHWEVGGGMKYMSMRYAANTNLIRVGGYTRWDATIAYRQPKYDIRLNLLNVFNKTYFDALVPSDGGRAAPGIGRTALLTGTYRF
ncbi:TonB-dependent receptor [Pandoraea terrigena]|uniref:Putative TonB-dependent receptor BfrD n=1 Tax=Pandoraea terrigena TaxID=2508292 RepID=A0A5E4RJH4_9BURK|nr:TonB-dependent siderophore receptor [Pandoraea terrigena]VVD63043.1 putative TonB-dependent receptor BfrD [Pandoraea terrigena]